MLMEHNFPTSARCADRKSIATPLDAVNGFEEIAARLQELSALTHMAAIADDLDPGVALALRGLSSLTDSIRRFADAEGARFSEAVRAERLRPVT